MENKDNERISELQTFKEFRDPETPQVWRPDEFCKFSDSFKHDIHFSNVSYANKTRKPMYLRSRSRLKRHRYDHPRPFSCRAKLTFPDTEMSASVSQWSAFERRKITTIQEEVFQYKKQFRPKHESFRLKKSVYKDKVASLKVVVGRLKEMCLAKPEVLQNKLPEDIMKLFSDIQI